MPVIAIISAGPGMGHAISRTFGKQGYKGAIVPRSRQTGLTYGRPSKRRHRGGSV